VLTLAVSAHTKKAQKSVWKDGPLKKSFSRTANENRGAGRQSRTTKSIEKFLVFKDGFEKISAAQRMRISSVKTAAHFDQFDGKSIELIFLLNKESFD